MFKFKFKNVQVHTCQEMLEILKNICIEDVHFVRYMYQTPRWRIRKSNFPNFRGIWLGTRPWDSDTAWKSFASLLVAYLVETWNKQSRFEELVARITVTLSIFNFSTWFFAQIVENRETQLSSPFLGPGDNFYEKLWRKPDLVRPHARAARETLAGSIPTIMHQIPRARFSADPLRPDLVFVITFRKNCPQDLKMG